MYRFLFFYANMIVNKNEVLNKVKLKLKLLQGLVPKTCLSCACRLWWHQINSQCTSTGRNVTHICFPLCIPRSWLGHINHGNGDSCYQTGNSLCSSQQWSEYMYSGVAAIIEREVWPVNSITYELPNLVEEVILNIVTSDILVGTWLTLYSQWLTNFRSMHLSWLTLGWLLADCW